MDQKMNFLAIADFNLVASHGGFGLASRASGRPKATLSRHVMDLEQSLGIRLLERDGRAFRLTEEGKTLHARTEGLLSEVSDTARGVAGENANPCGKLRVSCPLMFGHLMMGRLAAEFIQRYPQVQLEITVEDRAVDLIEEGFDLVIRVNPRADSNLVGRCFRRDQLLIVAPPSFVFPDPGAQLDVAIAIPAVVGMSTLNLEKRIVTKEGIERRLKLNPVLRLASPLMVRDAALAGAGIAVLPQFLVAQDLSTGRLVNWGSLVDGSIEVWALHVSRRLTNRKVSAFLNFLCEADTLSATRQMPGSGTEPKANGTYFGSQS
jgi:DNA-binding transcriptional LysR family regulator